MTTRPTELVLGASAGVLLDTYNTQVLQSARYVQEVLTGTNADLIYGVETLPQGGESFVVNGGFEDWSNGGFVDNPSVATGVHGPLGWGVLGGSVAQSAAAEGNRGSCCVFTSHAPPGAILYQSTYTPFELRGRTVTFSVRMKGGRVTASLADDTGASAFAPPVDCTDQIWRTLVVSYTVAATATRVTCALAVDPNQTAYFDAASLVCYGGPVAYAPPGAPVIASLLQNQHLFVRTINLRWRALAANDRVQIYVPWRAAPLPAALVPVAPGAEIGLIFPGNPPTTDANIDLANTVVLDWDANGANVQVASLAAAADSYMYGLKLYAIPATI